MLPTFIIITSILALRRIRSDVFRFSEPLR